MGRVRAGRTGLEEDEELVRTTGVGQREKLLDVSTAKRRKDRRVSDSSRSRGN